ncbi:MAG TPA: YtxH domain-containing protein [Anaerolineales bacterium]|nr:YtxH domain-containing protein [Anaerolineales bacterium]
MTTQNHTRKFVLGTLIGGIIGSVAALLMAPRSGEKTQKLILETGENWRQEAENRLQNSRQYMEDKINETRDSISEWLSNGSVLLDEKSEEIKLEKTNGAKKTKQTTTA